MWEDVENSIQRACAIIATITNLLLLHLIINKSPKKFGAYKYLMIYISVFEIIYAIEDVLIVPQLFTHGSAYLVIVDSDKTILPASLLPFFDLLYCAAFGMSIAIFDVHFVFRYLAVTGNVSWTTNKSSKLFVWISIPLALGLIYAVICNMFLGPNEIVDKFIRDKLVVYSHKNIEADYYIGFYFYSTDSCGRKVVNWWNITGTFFVTLTIFISSVIMFYFGFKCYKEIKKLSTKTSRTSARSRSVQSQLFYALVLQTVIPLTLMHIPAGVLFFTCFADSSFELMGRVVSVTIAMYPALDPLPNMFIINDYRKAITDYCSMCCTRRSVVRRGNVYTISTTV